MEDLRRGDLDIVLTEYDAAHTPPREPGLAVRRLAFDPYILIVPQDWAITVHSPGDLEGRPWIAGPPGTACDHALRRVAAQAGVTTAASDVCVEFPSVIALVEAGRGAAIIPRLALTCATVTIYPLPELGGRHIAALHRAGTGYPAPATAAVLRTLAETGQQLTRTLTAASSHRPLHQNSPHAQDEQIQIIGALSLTRASPWPRRRIRRFGAYPRRSAWLPTSRIVTAGDGQAA